MSIWSDIWEVFFPRYCVVCGKRLCKEEDGLCITCYSLLPRTKMHLSPGNVMEKNFWGRLPIERATAFLFYSKGGDVSKLLYELKYYGNRELGFILGKCMAEEMKESGFFQGIDAIVPVPLHPKKKRSRGYNQSEVLAKGISSILDIPIVDDVLKRNQNTTTQTHKSRFGRWMNVDEAFECCNAEKIKGKHILLLDDVVTTGATIVACSDALKEVQGLRISVLGLALAGET